VKGPNPRTKQESGGGYVFLDSPVVPAGMILERSVSLACGKGFSPFPPLRKSSQQSCADSLQSSQSREGGTSGCEAGISHPCAIGKQGSIVGGRRLLEDAFVRFAFALRLSHARAFLLERALRAG